MKRIVIALGGNALLKKGEAGFNTQRQNAKKTAKVIADIIEAGFEVLIAHGNGRQVGSILLKSARAKDDIPPLPLDAAVAETQGQIGYAIQQTLQNEFNERNIEKNVASLVTQVRVNPADPAFEDPTKFVGPYYSKQEAKTLETENNWTMKKDPRGGWRRVVPSPDPKEILEIEIVKKLLSNASLVVTVGGGGIPVIKEENHYKGVPAVIDKDLASELLAEEIDADKLIILTDIAKVMLNFDSDHPEPIQEMSAEEADHYYNKGHFKPGSMGPKVRAGIRFVRSGAKRRCVIAHLNNAYKAVQEDAGTVIYSNSSP